MHVYIYTASCVNGQVRLVNGSMFKEGRVEVCVDGRWGTVCGDEGWTETQASDLCNQLGYFGESSKEIDTAPIYIAMYSNNNYYCN